MIYIASCTILCLISFYCPKSYDGQHVCLYDERGLRTCINLAGISMSHLARMTPYIFPCRIFCTSEHFWRPCPVTWTRLMYIKTVLDRTHLYQKKEVQNSGFASFYHIKLVLTNYLGLEWCLWSDNAEVLGTGHRIPQRKARTYFCSTNKGIFHFLIIVPFSCMHSQYLSSE